MYNRMQLEELLDLKEKINKLNKYELYEMVKCWSTTMHGPAISCVDQLKESMINSLFFKEFNKGNNSDLFRTKLRSECAHFISLLEE